jgi:hypothetical protein
LLELSDRHKKQGLGDAPWPPQYKKQADEPTRVQPSRAKHPSPKPQAPSPSGRRVSKRPLITVAHDFKKEVALEALEAWKAKHPDVVKHLETADILVDSMRGRSSTWTRIRINLQHVPEELRPPQPELPPTPNPWEGVNWETGRRSARARKAE